MLKTVLRIIDLKLATFFAKSPSLSSFYYCFFSRQFDREHFRVLNSRVEFHHLNIKSGQLPYLLRRSIHRLEKGLIMQPRKKVFGESYIKQAVESFIARVNLINQSASGSNADNSSALTAELKWANDVLELYFRSTNMTLKIQSAKEQYEQFIRKMSYFDTDLEHTNKFVPYEQKQIKSSNISFEQLSLLFHQRRSTRFYRDDKVELSKIKKAIELAHQAPSACNRQPFEFRVFNSIEDARSIASLAMGTQGLHQNFQSLVVILGDLNAYDSERDRHLIYIDGSLAAMQFMLALETLGLSSCPINWPDIEFREQLMDQRLQLPSNLRPIMLVALGYADKEGMIPFSHKNIRTNITQKFKTNEH